MIGLSKEIKNIILEDSFLKKYQVYNIINDEKTRLPFIVVKVNSMIPEYLKDNFIGAIHNLKEGKYFFLSQIGDFKNRFELVFKKPSVSQEIIVDNQVFVFVNAGKINLTSSDKNIQSFEIYDVLGKQIVSKNNINNKEYIVSGLTSSNQSLIVRLVLEDGRQITKKVVF